MIKEIHNKWNRLILACVISMASGLIGCSDGSSPESPAPVKSNAVSDVAISGTASKGIIKAATVTAEELSATGDVVAEIGSAVTDANGHYSLTLSNQYKGGSILISVIANENTQMKCDVPVGCGKKAGSEVDISFGEFYKPGAFTITALIPYAQANETISVNVTPFTHMAAARAKTSITLDASVISSANSEVSNLLGGIDIINTAPVDITDPLVINNSDISQTQIVYAAMASALANQGMFDADGHPDLDAAIKLLANSFLNGVMEADDAQGDDAAQISLQEILSATEETFLKMGKNDVTGILSKLLADIEKAKIDGGKIDPVASSSVNDPIVKKAKAMMRDIRTWGSVINAEAGAKKEVFTTEIELASNAIAILGSAGLTDAMTAAAVAAIKFDVSQTDLSNVYYNDISLGGNFESGTITSPSDGVILINNGLVSGYTVTVVINGPADGTIANQFSIGITEATIVGENNSLFINSGLVEIKLSEDYTINYTRLLNANLLKTAGSLSTKPAAGSSTENVQASIQVAVFDSAPIVVQKPEITDLTFSIDVEFTQHVDATGKTLASPINFTGEMAFDLDIIPVINNIENLVLPKTFSLSGVIDNAQGDRLTATIVANVSNTSKFKFIGDYAPNGTLYSLSHAAPFIKWGYTDMDAIAGVDTYTYTSPEYTYKAYWDAQTKLVNSSYYYNCLGCVYVVESVRTYNSLALFIENTYQPTAVYATVDGEGLYSADTSAVNYSESGSLDGVLIDPEFIYESASNWIDADMGLTFVAQLNDLPEARINVVADRDGFDAGKAAITISYGDRQLKLSATVTESELEGSFSVTNQDNIVFTLDKVSRDNTQDTVLSGMIMYNGLEVASVSETDNGLLKVSYSDGTFEIF